MKDKLRELAARWKGPECRNGSSHECADELLAILNAEGDGGAVAQVDAGEDGLFVEILYGPDGSPLKVGDKLYTHPARSGVVSDEDVARMDWLVSHDVEVRDPQLHGSVHLFTAQTTSDEEDEFYRTSLREQIDSAIQGERHER